METLLNSKTWSMSGGTDTGTDLAAAVRPTIAVQAVACAKIADTVARAEVEVGAGVQGVDGVGQARLAALCWGYGHQSHGCDPAGNGRR